LFAISLPLQKARLKRNDLGARFLQIWLCCANAQQKQQNQESDAPRSSKTRELRNLMLLKKEIFSRSGMILKFIPIYGYFFPKFKILQLILPLLAQQTL
jgi:hypothetical protein